MWESVCMNFWGSLIAAIAMAAMIPIARKALAMARKTASDPRRAERKRSPWERLSVAQRAGLTAGLGTCGMTIVLGLFANPEWPVWAPFAIGMSASFFIACLAYSAGSSAAMSLRIDELLEGRELAEAEEAQRRELELEELRSRCLELEERLRSFES